MPVVIVCSVLELVPPAVAAARPWEAAFGPAAEALPAAIAERAGGVRACMGDFACTTLSQSPVAHAKAAVIVPLLDCIPAALVSLIVTNAQAVSPGQVARLFAETF